MIIFPNFFFFFHKIKKTFFLSLSEHKMYSLIENLLVYKILHTHTHTHMYVYIYIYIYIYIMHVLDNLVSLQNKKFHYGSWKHITQPKVNICKYHLVTLSVHICLYLSATLINLFLTFIFFFSECSFFTSVFFFLCHFVFVFLILPTFQLVRFFYLN